MCTNGFEGAMRVRSSAEEEAWNLAAYLEEELLGSDLESFCTSSFEVLCSRKRKDTGRGAGGSQPRVYNTGSAVERAKQ